MSTSEKLYHYNSRRWCVEVDVRVTRSSIRFTAWVPGGMFFPWITTMSSGHDVSEYELVTSVLVFFYSSEKNKTFSLIPQRELYLTVNSHITLSNVVSPLNLVSIFRCPSPPRNPVYVRLADPSVLSFSLSSHRHPYICIPCSSHFIY